jgi:hypothetical protein
MINSVEEEVSAIVLSEGISESISESDGVFSHVFMGHPSGFVINVLMIEGHMVVQVSDGGFWVFL